MKFPTIFLLLLSVACSSSTGPTTMDQTMDQMIREALDRASIPRVAIAYQSLTTDQSFSLNENEVFHAASTMKVPVMMAIFAAIEKGDLSLDQPVPVIDQFVSIYDGSTYAVGAEEDSDPELYDHLGETLPLHDLVRRMVVRSSNLATNILIGFVGADRVTAMIREAGANRMEVLRGVQDLKAYEAGMSNTATAHDLMVVLAKIANSARAENGGPADAMVEILKHQEFNEGIPAGLPPGTTVAHKTGSITNIYHDAAIIYPENQDPYVLVVLTGGASDDAASKLVARISEIIWEEHTR